MSSRRNDEAFLCMIPMFLFSKGSLRLELIIVGVRRIHQGNIVGRNLSSGRKGRKSEQMKAKASELLATVSGI